MEEKGPEESTVAEHARLMAQWAAIYADPNVDLDFQAKKLRQGVFKQQYKMRRQDAGAEADRLSVRSHLPLQ